MSNLIQITKDQAGKEIVMVRVDKTLKEIMEEKPSSRWDAQYWHPKWEEFYKMSLQTVDFKDLIQDITYGQVGQRIFSKKGTVHYLQVINIKPSGIDMFAKIATVEEGSRNDPIRSRIKPGQILLTRTTFPGMDTLIGRCVVVSERDKVANVSEDIDVITLKVGVSPEVVCTFLKTKFGQGQINHKKKGVKSIKVNFDEIGSIKIPVFSESDQLDIISQYRNMSIYHEKAMEAKKNGEEDLYKNNLNTAEIKLKDLISKTEETIRNRR